MEVAVGVCRFCGSTQMIESSSKLLEGEANLAALARCVCSGALRYKRIGRAHELVGTVCEMEDGELEVMDGGAVMIIKELCESVVDGAVDKIMLTIGGDHIKMVCKDGEVAIERKRTIKIEGRV